MLQTLREINLRTSVGLMRKESVDGVEYTVVPVTALVEGVIQAVNAPTPEFVRADRFSIAPQGWDGRPVFVNHPMVGNRPVSGNSPEILKTAIGRIHNTKVDGKRLLMEAWLDPRVKGAQEVIRRCESDKPIEISTGALIILEKTKGTFNGKDYDGAWDIIIPDHLAILEEGLTGACNRLMGCGIRAACYSITGEELSELRELGGPGSGWTAEAGHTAGSQGGAARAHEAAIRAHQAAASAHRDAAAGKMSSKDAMKASNAAHQATKNTGGNPYANQAARTYAKLADKSQALSDKAKMHEEAARMHDSAASAHRTQADHMPGGRKFRNSQGGLMPKEKSLLAILVSKLSGKKVEELTPVERVLLTTNANGYQMDLSDPGEEDAELIQYQTISTLLNNIGTCHDVACSLVADLISAEADEGADENAEEEVESAQLDSIRTHCMSMISTLSSIMDLCRSLTAEDRPMLMAYMSKAIEAQQRIAAGKRHNSTDEQIIQSVHDQSVALGADCAAMKAAQNTSTCGCGNNTAGATHEGAHDMTREQRITALMSSEHNPLKDKKALDASSEEGLKALEAHVEKETKVATDRAAAEKKVKDDAAAKEVAERAAQGAKPKSKEDWLKDAPAEIRTLVEEAEAERTAEHTSLVAELKAAQKTFTEDDLKAKTNKELRQLHSLVIGDKTNDQEATTRVNFAGRVPRDNSGDKKTYMEEPPPNGYRIALDKQSGGSGKEKVN